MSKLALTEVAITQARPGALIYDRVDTGDGMQMALFVRETPSVIDRLGSQPVIEIRLGLIRFDAAPAAPVVLMLSVRGDFYETWINYQDHQGAVALVDLASQEQLRILFYDGTDTLAKACSTPRYQGSLAH